MDIVDENAGKEIGVICGDTVGDKISVNNTSNTENGDKLTGDSVKGKTVDNSIINDKEHKTVTGYGSGDKVVCNIEGGDKGSSPKCNIDNDLADKNANATPNDDSLPFSIFRDILKKYN